MKQGRGPSQNPRVRARWVGLAGAAIAVALVPLVPSGVPVLAAAAAAVVGGLVPLRRTPAGDVP